jgi:hypothetical protein
VRSARPTPRTPAPTRGGDLPAHRAGLSLTAGTAILALALVVALIVRPRETADNRAVRA